MKKIIALCFLALLSLHAGAKEITAEQFAQVGGIKLAWECLSLTAVMAPPVTGVKAPLGTTRNGVSNGAMIAQFFRV